MLFDGVLHCLCFVLTVFVWCPCMAINVSVQYSGGLHPTYTVDPMLLPSLGNPFKCHEEEVLYLQPLIPPKRFDIFSPRLGGAQKD